MSNLNFKEGMSDPLIRECHEEVYVFHLMDKNRVQLGAGGLILSYRVILFIWFKLFCCMSGAGQIYLQLVSDSNVVLLFCSFVFGIG